MRAESAGERDGGATGSVSTAVGCWLACAESEPGGEVVVVGRRCRSRHDARVCMVERRGEERGGEAEEGRGSLGRMASHGRRMSDGGRG